MKDQNCLVHHDDQAGEGSTGELRHTARKFIRQVSLLNLTSLFTPLLPTWNRLQGNDQHVAHFYVFVCNGARTCRSLDFCERQLCRAISTGRSRSVTCTHTFGQKETYSATQNDSRRSRC